MPRQPDAGLEDRVLNAAHALWRRGGDQALTMRAVARAAGTNTPAMYRRFRNRQDLVRGLLRRIASRIGERFNQAQNIEEMADAYVEFALRMPHEYQLFYSHARELSPRKAGGKPRPIRESRPNFALLEQLLAKRLGGAPENHTKLALAIWAMLHGTTMLLLAQSIPQGHEEQLRGACRAAVKALISSSMLSAGSK